MREHYQKRDRLRLIVDYRKKYLDSLVRGGDEEAKSLHLTPALSPSDAEREIAKLTAAINRAKDAGDIATLREIAEDPNGYILRQGWASLDFSDEAELNQLRRLPVEPSPIPPPHVGGYADYEICGEHRAAALSCFI